MGPQVAGRCNRPELGFGGSFFQLMTFCLGKALLASRRPVRERGSGALEACNLPRGGAFLPLERIADFGLPSSLRRIGLFKGPALGGRAEEVFLFLRSSITLHRALVAAAVIIPAVTFLAAALENRRAVLREGENSVMRTAAILDEHARKVFDTVDLLLGRVDDHLHHMLGDDVSKQAGSEFLRAIKAPLPQAVSVWVSDRHGKVLAGSQDWDPNVSIADRPFFMTHEKGSRRTEISEAFVGRATNIASVAVSRARIDKAGAFDGIIHVSVSPDYFATVFREAAPEGNHLAMLMRADGSALALDPPRRPFPKFERQEALMRQIADAPEGGIFQGPSPIDGVRGFYAYRRVAPYDLYVVFGQSNAALAARWYMNLRLYGAVAGAASIFLLVLSLLALRRVQTEQEALRQLSIQSEQRLAAEQRLFQSQKLESIGQLTGGIAHDFNNLLSVVLGNLSLLSKFVRGNERAENLLERAMQGAERGATLTQRLLAFARRQELAPKVVDVAELVRGIMDLLRSTLGGGVEIVADLNGDVPPALIDPNQLELALVNLAVNARDAMPQGGRIIILLRAAELAEGNDLALPAGDYVCLSMADNGTGMDAQTLARASEPFFTTKDVGRGTGLGLSMVHGLASQSGGAFRLDSVLGQGTRAEIWLPRAEHVARDAPLHMELAPAARRGARLLVVDDDDLVRHATADLLTDHGYVVVQAASAQKALALLESQDFDLLVTDLVMPGMSGVDLLRQVGHMRPHLPALVMTGHSQEAGDVPAHVTRLSKPLSERELTEAVARLLASELLRS